MIGNMFDSLEISSTALRAERTRMNVISNNLANMNTTRGPDGGPYRRQYVVFKTLLEENAAADGTMKGRGVAIDDVEGDMRPFQKVYKPGHPDADEQGYLSLPNVNMAEENVDMLMASRSYDANLAALRLTKSMIRKILDLMTGQ